MTKSVKYLAAAAVVALCGAAMPAPAQAQYQQQATYHEEGTLSPLSGVYMGGFAGYGWTDAEVDGLTDPDINGGDYGVFVGYQMDTLLDRTIGLGINGALEGHWATSDADDSAGGVSYDKKQEWGVSFRPGLSFVDSYMPLGLKPYGIVGYRRAEFKASVPGASSNEWYNGFELGVGTELIAYQDFGVRLDYSHVWYGEKDGVDPSEDNLRLGVAYHF